jgi:hypothetical protein
MVEAMFCQQHARGGGIGAEKQDEFFMTPL